LEPQTLGYFQKTKLNSNNIDQISQYLKALKALKFALTEAEIVQIANLLPETDVEFYLVSPFLERAFSFSYPTFACSRIDPGKLFR
jgi:hypothetical protein